MSDLLKNTEPRVKKKFPSTTKIRVRDELIAREVILHEQPVSEVSRKFGLSRQAVYGVLDRVRQDTEIINEYNAKKAEVQAHNQMRRQVIQDKILDSIKEDDITQADLKTKMMALNTLGMDKTREFEAERLVRGQSTDNVAVIVQAWKDIKKKRRDAQEVQENPRVE